MMTYKFACSGEAAAHEAGESGAGACYVCKEEVHEELLYTLGPWRVACGNCWERLEDRREERQRARGLLRVRRVETVIRHMDPRSLGTKEERDAFADEMLAQERARETEARK